ncbi:MAG TPA: hypothetical protein VHV30_07605 [Polyangiaceae bacterium]|nr:hypothetical protein [Polyangiaceae bacterium]
MRAAAFLRFLGPLGLVVAGVAGAGCAAATGTVSPSDIEADAQISTVQSALSTPTSAVSSTTARSLATHVRSYQRMLPAFQTLLMLESPAAEACLSGSPTGGSYDLGCLTHLQVMGSVSFGASGGSVDGAFQGRLTGTLNDVCSGAACVNGTAAIDFATIDGAPAATLAVSAAVAWQGDVDDFSFGVQGDVGGQLDPKVVYIDANRQSLVVDGAGDPSSSGPFTVSGADHGSFQCVFDADSGKCSGPTSFSF